MVSKANPLEIEREIFKLLLRSPRRKKKLDDMKKMYIVKSVEEQL